MKKINQLTPMEREFATLHHNLVYRFLHQKGLSEQEFYDVVIFGYLAAVQNYLEKEELQSYSFTTVAWREMESAVSEEFRYRNRLKRSATVMEYQEETALHGLDELLPGRMDALVEMLDRQDAIKQLLPFMTQKELEAVCLKALGFTYSDIASQYSITANGVGSRFHRLRKRIRQNMETMETVYEYYE